ncbi:ABC transporter ATP-binding protein [Nocardioides sp. KR10-350]|uniref:ABC transporter ATP-binding protein n=1 Tax=Nocardioides cheoyonin TaxID=3156615 RepID=UPI0032B3F0CC
MPTKPDLARTGPGSPAGPTEPGDVVLDVDDLSVHYRLAGGAAARLFGLGTSTVKAVDGVTLRLRRGEVLGVVGESGSGKTTLGRALLGLAPATGGSITYRPRSGGDRRVSDLRGRALRELRTDLQMVFQDPHAALNPTMTVAQAVGDPLRIHGVPSADLGPRVRDALERVGLAPVDRYLGKYPSDLSGGQKQRVVMARAIILGPEVLVADEPISMLDMSVRAKILELMLELKRDLGLSYVYITHDLASAKFFCDRIAIMYLGRVVEIGSTEEIFADPKHPYTRALLAAIPEPDPDRSVPRELPRGEIPDAASPPLGCSFHPRCPQATAVCGWESRDLRTLLEEHWTRRDPATYAAEGEVIGDLGHLDAPAASVELGRAGAAKVHDLMDRIRAENPDEPLWQGVEAIEDTGSGVRVRFHEGVDPALRRAGGVDVACVLYAGGGEAEDAAKAKASGRSS